MKTFLNRSFALAIVLLMTNLFLINKSFSQGSQTFSTAGTFVNGFTVPAGVSSITVQVWGGGGGGGLAATNSNGKGGGGGGAYTSKTYAVNAGDQFTIIIGQGGAGGTSSVNGQNGGQSSFDGTLIALGGTSGNNGTGTGSTAAQGGAGGVAGITGTINSAGSAGGNGNTATSGTGGGGGASGNAAGTLFPGANGTAGGAGGNGPDGDGGAGGTNTNPGLDGVGPGGGGGGRGDQGSVSGNGTDGQVKITWTCPAATISYPASTSVFCKSNTSVSPTITGSTGGTFSSSAGLSINSIGVINPSASTAGTYTVHYQFAAGNGCSAVDATASVTINALPSASAVKDNDVKCFETSTGQITVSGNGGSGGYSFSIDNGVNYDNAPYYQGSGIFNGLPIGIYKIRVKDSNGCESKSVQ